MPAKSYSLENLRPTLGFQAAALAVSVAAATIALSAAYQSTKDSIAAAQALDVSRSLAQVLPDGSYDNDIGADVVRSAIKDKPVLVHVARKDGAVSGVVIELSERGYSGEIALVMGVDRAGRVTGVRITRHTETPGLGDKIEKTKTDWVDSFLGRALGDPPPERWAVRKDGGDFDQFAGATITPRAVLRAVKAGLELFASEHERWLTPARDAGQGGLHG